MMPDPPTRAGLGRDFINFCLSVAFYLVCAPLIAAAHMLDNVFRTRSFEVLVRLIEALDNGHHAPSRPRMR